MRSNGKFKDLWPTFIFYGFVGLIAFWAFDGFSLIEDSEDTDIINEIDSYYDSNPIKTSVDHDCGDFSSAYEAQMFFEANGSSDPHDLDRYGDGYACEWNPQ